MPSPQNPLGNGLSRRVLSEKDLQLLNGGCPQRAVFHDFDLFPL